MNSESKYLKSDEYYIDKHDRMMFNILKRQEVRIEKVKTGLNDVSKVAYCLFEQKILLNKKYDLWKKRESTINEWKNKDKALDKLLESSIPINDVLCNTCSSVMHVSGHFLREENTKVLFLYDCSSGHFPKRMFYPDGNEYVYPVKRCPDCNGELGSKSEEKENSLRITDFCTVCDFSEIEVMKLGEADKPFTAEERKKYCFLSKEEEKNGRNFKEDIDSVLNVAAYLEEHEKEQSEAIKYKVDDIKIVKVPIVEQELLELTNKLKYSKFQFEQPKITRFITVDFSLQDPTDRTENESVKLLKREFNKHLLMTNWRLSNC